jgi:hypothetical protein
LIVVATLLLIGNIIVSKIATSLDPGYGDAELNETIRPIYDNITGSASDAFQLSATTPIILGAALILTVILGFAAVVVRQ